VLARAARLWALLLLCAAAFAPAPLWAKSLEFERFDVELRVQRDGSVLVTETLRVRFTGEWNGVFRDIPLRFRNARGRPVQLEIDVARVTDDAGRPLEYESSRGGGYRKLKVWVPGAHDATRTVVIEYRVRNALLHFGEAQPEGLLDELYWNALPEETDGPIRAARVRVHLPDGVVASQAAAAQGPAGTADAVPVRIEGGTVTVEATRPLVSGEHLTLAVGWPGGAVARPGAAAGLVGAARAFWPLLLPWLAFWGMLGRWRRHGRDPTPRAIAVQYEPPAALSPAEIGTLVDHSADMHDVTATIVDLAVRGYLTIEEQEEKKLLGLATSRDFVFHAVRPRAEWSALAPHEQRFVEALFAPGTPAAAALPVAAGASADAAPAPHASVRLSQLTNRFYQALPGIRTAIYAELVRKGHYLRRPDTQRGGYIGAAFTVGMLGTFAALFVAESGFLGLHAGAVALGMGLSALLIGVFGWLMPARTERGARAREAALGFREFLDRVESDRYRRMITSPEMFERYLPFAMAFRVEDRWARAFEALCTTPPQWYRGGQPQGFRTTALARDLGRMRTQAGSAMTSSPSSSGSGGGVRSGGGGGGGRAGGF
jgi:uncharacterized membrane protein YgcG